MPLWVEREFTNLRHGFSLAGLPLPTWRHLLVWSNYHTRLLPIPYQLDHWYGGYIGIVPFLLAVIGTCLGWGRGGHWRWSGIGLAMSLLLILGYRWPVIRDISIIQAMNAGRYQLFLVFFVAISAGLSVPVIAERVGRLDWHYASLILLLGFDLGTTTFRMPYLFAETAAAIRMEQSTLDEMLTLADVTPQSPYSSARMVHPHNSFNSVLVVATRTPSILCIYDEHTRAAGLFLRPVIYHIEDQIGQSETADAWIESDAGRMSLDALYLTGTRYHFTPVDGGLRTTELELTPDSPVQISSVIERWTGDLNDRNIEQVLDLVAAMGVNRTMHQANRIFVVNHDTEILDIEPPSIQVGTREVHIDHVQIELTTDRPAFARLAFGYTPSLRVQVDSLEVETMMTAGGFTAIRVPTGHHTIRVSGRLSTLRRVLLAVDLALLAALCVWCRKSKADD